MKRFTWNELYERADDKPYGSPELRAKDEARYQLGQEILEKTGEDIEKAEIPEEALEDYLERLAKDNKHIVFDENGNIVDAENSDVKDDVFILVPEKGQIIRIAEGTGDNLLKEDIDAGYVDYIYYEQYSLEQDLPEVDGGQILLTAYIWEKYDSLLDAAEDVLEMAYGNCSLSIKHLD